MAVAAGAAASPRAFPCALAMRPLMVPVLLLLPLPPQAARVNKSAALPMRAVIRPPGRCAGTREVACRPRRINGLFARIVGGRTLLHWSHGRAALRAVAHALPALRGRVGPARQRRRGRRGGA